MAERVEVWVESTRRWVPGFEVRRRLGDGSCVIARPGEVPLPSTLPPERVRPDAGLRQHPVAPAGGQHAGRPLGRRW